jgi:hypothetical protein
MKGSFGFLAMVLGILGISRGGIDSPHQSLGQMIMPIAGTVSIPTLAAVFLLVGGLLVLAKSARFSLEGSQDHANPDSSNGALPLEPTDVHSPNANT